MKQQRTQVTNRANGILTGYGFTVFRLVTLNTSAGLKILQLPLPEYIIPYLEEVLGDVNTLNDRIKRAEFEVLDKFNSYKLEKQVDLMTTVSGGTSMLALRIIADLGANYHQRYSTAEAFSKAFEVVPASEVTVDKMVLNNFLKRKEVNWSICYYHRLNQSFFEFKKGMLIIYKPFPFSDIEEFIY